MTSELLSANGDHLRIKCSCGNVTVLSIANLIAIVGPDITTHEVRQRAKCANCVIVLDSFQKGVPRLASDGSVGGDDIL